MLSALPDELLLLLVAKLDAAAACRLSQVDRTMQRWILLHHEEWVYTWRHARAWLVLCDMAQARVRHRWASVRSRNSVVWNHFTPAGGSLNRVYVRCCCAEGVGNGNACGVVLNVNNAGNSALEPFAAVSSGSLCSATPVCVV